MLTLLLCVLTRTLELCRIVNGRKLLLLATQRRTILMGVKELRTVVLVLKHDGAIAKFLDKAVSALNG
jgi:hypothetical protein